MEGLKPGRIVYFVASEGVINAIERQRAIGLGHSGPGNRIAVGESLPAMVTKVWDLTTGGVNLKVMLDGPDTYWATSVPFHEGDAPGTWHWMYEGQATGRPEPVSS